ncbi:MAG: AMP-binding protein [Pseudomonadota bacterium]
MSTLTSDNKHPDGPLGNAGTPSRVREQLLALASEILATEIDPTVSLVAQGLDSLAADELLAVLKREGFHADYEALLDGASVTTLVAAIRPASDHGPRQAELDPSRHPAPLLGAQRIWSELEALGWGSWANISLCLSMPAALIPAAELPAMVQALCDRNEGMRMQFVPPASDGDAPEQRVIPGFQLPVRMQAAPADEQQAMRLVEAFEGEVATPKGPSTRVLVLGASEADGRHWLCITMHHCFADRIAMHSLYRQLCECIRARTTDTLPQQNTAPQTVGFMDVARWQAERSDGTNEQQARETLRECLGDAAGVGHAPRLRDGLAHDLEIPAGAFSFSAAETAALKRQATALDTTLPLLLHALFDVLLARLSDEAEDAPGVRGRVLCHVVSNREGHEALRQLVGCMDTSIPIALDLEAKETLQSLCLRTRTAFANALPCASVLPRGSWLLPEYDDNGRGKAETLIECVPHLNIVQAPAQETFGDANQEGSIQVHPVQRVQQTRWGLLLRVTLPAAGMQQQAERGHRAKGLQLRAIAEDRSLATAVQLCLPRLLRSLLTEPDASLRDLPILPRVDQVIDQFMDIARHVRRTAALGEAEASSAPFIWERLVNRQQRWYEHDEQCRLLRDSDNRFLGTRANPFPFTQLDKLAERRYLTTLGAPQPKLLHVLPREGLRDALLALVPNLPASFAIKPVGAGHSFGVTLVREGRDLTRGGAPFDAEAVVEELATLARRGTCTHEGKTFPFNFSSFLVEELVVDERGFEAPTDYKLFMLGDSVLWLQLHFREAGQNWVAFVDESLHLLPEPAWNPRVCWRTHGALVCMDPAQVEARRPACLPELIEHARRLGRAVQRFVRLDWYADHTHGPLLGEMTLFPHMLQPRNFYSAWANRQVEAACVGHDGLTTDVRSSDALGRRAVHRRITDHLAACTGTEKEALHESAGTVFASLSGLVPSTSATEWSEREPVSWAALRQYIDRFDLAPWDVAPGARVALLLPNGVELAGLLLAVMNRYTAVPLDAEAKGTLLRDQLEDSAANVLLVLAGSEAASQARHAADRLKHLRLIELHASDAAEQSGPPSPPTETRAASLAELPSPPAASAKARTQQSAPATESVTARTRLSAPATDNTTTRRTPPLGSEAVVLQLRTSGTTGTPRTVPFTGARLLQASAAIADSLRLRPADKGISMLPLHHVGGLSCNLVAPFLAGSSMVFLRRFDPRAFFGALAGEAGASWCYLAAPMWTLVLEYAAAHPALRRDRPWPRLRLVRSAGADLPHRVAEQLADLFGPNVTILPTYGMTEAMPICAPPTRYRLERPGSVGPPLPGCAVELVDLDGGHSRVPDGSLGEIAVSGPGVLKPDDRYGNGNTATTKDWAFTDRGFLRTGDLGRLAADGSGWLTVTGRRRDAINRGGEILAPAEIEAVLKGYPGWPTDDEEVELLIFARSHATLQEDVALAVEPPSAHISLEALNRWASTQLPSTMLPQTLVLAERLPVTKHGKRQRKAFAEAFNAATPPGVLGTYEVYQLSGDLRAPRLLSTAPVRTLATDAEADPVAARHGVGTTLERVLAITRAFLGDELPIDKDSFFDELGVNSLAAVILLNRLNEHFASDLPVWSLSDHPTPRAIALQLDQMMAPATLRHEKPAVKAVTRTRHPLRMLMLHGEGADADLMRLSLAATQWTEVPDAPLAFTLMDAPHPCPPKPHFHGAAVSAGLYGKSTYRSWGVTKADTLEASLAAVRRAFETQGPFDGIGGICDGGLVAALIAAERPELELFINLSSSPMSRLAEPRAHENWVIRCASLHLISTNDEILSLEELLQIPSRCRKALVLQHDLGHAVPPLTNKLKEEVNALLSGVTQPENEPRPQTPRVADKQVAHANEAHETLPGLPQANDSGFAETRPALEQRLTDIWHEVLPTDQPPGLDDRFVDLGGNSLHSMVLVQKIEEALGQALPHQALQRLETIRQQVDALKNLPLHPARRSATGNDGLSDEIIRGLRARIAAWQGERFGPASLLFGENTAGHAPALFWCCQGYEEFSRLARHLGADQPLYGMRSGHLVMENTQSNLNHLASLYTDELLAVQPEGPYVLGGNCQSARIAMQMALELQRRGEHVALLCLQEQVVPFRYDGRLALLFGERSKQNPAQYYASPEDSWQPFYGGEVAAHTISGAHGEFFESPNIETLAAALRSEIAQLGGVHNEAVVPSNAALPAQARRATLLAPERINAFPGEPIVPIELTLTNDSAATWTAAQAGALQPGYGVHAQGVIPAIHYGLGSPLPGPLEPGEAVHCTLDLAIPRRPGTYQVVIDLFDNGATWFRFNGSQAATLTLDVQPRHRLARWKRRLKAPSNARPGT